MVWDFFLRFVILAKSGSVVRKIAWLTMIGLVVSITALVLVLSIMTAMNRSQRERTLAVEPHLIIEIPEAHTVQSVENHPVNFRLKELGSRESFAYESQDVIIRTTDGKFRGGIARGMSWDGLARMLKRIQPTGHKSDEYADLTRPEPGEVVMGVDLAHALGVFEGDSILIVPPEGLLLPPSESPKYEKVRVRQILVTNVSEVDGQMIYYIAGETLTSLSAAASRKLGLEVRLMDADQAEDVQQKLVGFSDIVTQTWQERNSALFFALRLEKLMIGVFLGLASLIAGLSLISVISLLISQKTKEIGLLQAIGYSRAKVKKLFSNIGFLLAFCGIGGGLLIGGLLSLYLQWHPLNVLPDIYYDSQIPAEVQPFFMLVIAVVGLLLAYFGVRFSVNISVTAQPSQSLRNKN